MFVGTANIGIWGTEAGPHVYLFDELDLANPIGSHFFQRTPDGRPGHSDPINYSWMLARFGTPSDINAFGPLFAPLVIEERKALSCQPLAGYLKTITEPFGWGTIVSDFKNAVTWTQMKFSSDPSTAERQLCG